MTITRVLAMVAFVLFGTSAIAADRSVDWYQSNCNDSNGDRIKPPSAECYQYMDQVGETRIYGYLNELKMRIFDLEMRLDRLTMLLGIHGIDAR